MVECVKFSANVGGDLLQNPSLFLKKKASTDIVQLCEAKIYNQITETRTNISDDHLRYACLFIFVGVLIPQDISGMKEFKSNAKYILVVEKDAIFQKLLDEGALVRLAPVIIITVSYLKLHKN